MHTNSYVTLGFTVPYDAGLFASLWSFHFGGNWLKRPTLLPL